MAVYKDGDKWRVIYRYTNYKGPNSSVFPPFSQLFLIAMFAP